MTGRALLVFALFAALTPLAARADGKATDGNFNIEFTDVVSNGGLDMKIVRVYNSTTPFSGIFGFGWGADFEKYLEFIDDGSIIVHEWGGGANNKFSPGADLKLRTPAEVADLIMAAKEKEGFASEAERTAYRASLAKNHQAEWNKLVAFGLLNPPAVPLGAALTSDKFGHQELVRVRDGYEIHLPTVVQIFDATNGHLVLQRDQNGHSIAYRYTAAGELAEMSNDLGERYTFTFNPGGHVAEVLTTEGKRIAYRYSGADLVDSLDAGNNRYLYAYDRNHNMTMVKYPDGKAQEISYYPLAEDENVKRVVERDGSSTEYTYAGAGTDHTSYGEKTTDAHGKVVDSKSSEYFMAVGPNGTRYVKRTVTTLNGVVTETDRDPNGYATQIKTGNAVTVYAYDSQERVTLEQTATKKTETAYDPISGKPSQVTITEKGQSSVFRYTYDGRGNLLTATDGKLTLAVAYDEQGRKSTFTSKGNPPQVFRVEYNRVGNSYRFGVDGVGTITIVYDDAGKVRKVGEKIVTIITNPSGEIEPNDSPAGKKIDDTVNAVYTEFEDVLQSSGSTIF
jgi:YD repeat-containing protein